MADAAAGSPIQLADTDFRCIGCGLWFDYTDPHTCGGEPQGLHDWQHVPEAGGACDCHGIRQGWICGNCGDRRTAKYPDMPPIEGCEARRAPALPVEALRLLDEIIEGTTPDRIGRYEYLRDWVHKTAKKVRARLGSEPSDG